jgi:hypothetical protein
MQTLRLLRVGAPCVTLKVMCGQSAAAEWVARSGESRLTIDGLHTAVTVFEGMGSQSSVRRTGMKPSTRL